MLLPVLFARAARQDDAFRVDSHVIRIGGSSDDTFKDGPIRLDSAAAAALLADNPEALEKLSKFSGKEERPVEPASPLNASAEESGDPLPLVSFNRTVLLAGRQVLDVAGDGVCRWTVGLHRCFQRKRLMFKHRALCGYFVKHQWLWASLPRTEAGPRTGWRPTPTPPLGTAAILICSFPSPTRPCPRYAFLFFFWF